MLASINKRVDALVTWVERVLAVALLAGISLNVINVIGRYLAGFALNGVDEIEIYILIWIAFLGAALVTWRGSHLRMDVLILACPPAVRWLAHPPDHYPDDPPKKRSAIKALPFLPED